MKIRRRRGRLADAYTLTEMLVVLVIIGLLATIVGPRLFNRLDDAKRRTARLQIASIETAIDLFRLDVGRLPTQEEGLGALVSAPGAEADGWLGPYLARGDVPLDPWRRDYVYETDGEARAYRVLSLGADGREGGDGAAADLVGEGRELSTGDAASGLSEATRGDDFAVERDPRGPDGE